MRTVVRFLTPLVLLLAMLLPAGGASAAPAVTIRTETFMATENNCNNGELIVLEGFIQEVLKETKDGRFQISVLHGQATDDQGNEWVLNDTFQFTQEGTDTVRFYNHVRLIRNGSETNQYATVHITENRTNVEFHCRG